MKKFYYSELITIILIMNLGLVFAVQKLTNYGIPSYIIAKILDYNTQSVSVSELKQLHHYKRYAI